MADKKVSALVEINTLSADDLLMVVNDPAGTPESKKVTVGNLFGNVAVSTTHKALTTFTANTNHTGTTATFSANVVITGTGGVNADIADRMQVANVTSTYTTNTVFQSYVANTNSRVLVNEQLILGGANTLTTKIFNATTVANTASLIITTKSADPLTSNAATEGITAGTIFYSNTYLYVTTDSNTIKRVVLSTF